MYEFDTADWASAIAAVSTQPRFQRAKIRIEDWSQVETDWDVDTNETTVIGNPQDAIVYAGRARVIGVRWGTQSGGESQANATTISAVRVQIPTAVDEEGYGESEYDGDQYGAGLSGRVKRGAKVFVVESPRNPALEGLVFTITSDLQGSSAAARTFEAALDADVEVADA